MKNRLIWFLAPAVLVVFLCFSTQPAMAQASVPGPDQGQQGEFNGENVDTGAAALDTDPEATELSEAGEANDAGGETMESPSSLSTHISAVGTTASTAQDLDVDDGAVNDGNFDLQEISEVDTPGAK